MKTFGKLSLAAALAFVWAVPASVAAADKDFGCCCQAMAGSEGSSAGESEEMEKAKQSDCQEDTLQQEFDKTKFGIGLQRRLRDNPVDAENGGVSVRVTVKTTDRGAELKRFLQDNGGNLGSCHGSIVTAQIPYGTLPALSRLPTVERIEGDIKLFPMKQNAAEAE